MSRQYKLVFVGLVFLALAIFFIFRSLRQPPLDVQAQTMLRAALRNEPSVVYAHVHQSQIDQTGITEEKYEVMWRELIWPRLSKFKQVGEIGQESTAGGAQGVAWATLKDASGHTYDFAFAPFATPSGSGEDLLFHPLLECWILENVIMKGKPVTTATILEAYITGLTTDRKVLSDLDIEGLPSREPGGQLTTWDEVQTKWRSRLAKLKNPRN